MHHKTARIAVGIAFALGAIALPAAAAAGSRSAVAYDESAPAETITGTAHAIQLAPGLSRMVELPQDASEVFVGNPAVANALVRSARKLYIVAINSGQTSIYAMDRTGRQIASFQVNVAASAPAPHDVSELGRILRAALPRADIVVRSIGDTIILTGTVPSAGDAQQAFDIAKGFLPSIITTTPVGGTSTSSGQVVNSLTIRGKDQVMLKVSIIEVQRSVMKDLGVNTNIAWQNGQALLNNPISAASPTGVISNTINGSSNRSLTQTLQAFERYGVSRVLAEPTVTAVSGESAKFVAGGEIPVPSSQTCLSGVCTTGIEFKQYGVTLNFSPVVLSEGRILLRLATEVTEIDPDRSQAIGTGSATQAFTVPAFRTRKNETSVELPSGGSIVSAGLLQTNTRQVITGLPGAMNLPILGSLFRSRDYQRDETELMIVVTPYIAKTLNPDEIQRPNDGFADATDPQTVFLGRVNRLYSTKSNPQALHNYKGRVGFITD